MNEVKKKEAIRSELQYANGRRAYLEATLKVIANDNHIDFICVTAH